jgi:AraC family transcriptional regulator of adaptative response/methylated-DNA-[protein]-cysteine methyltransferase
MSHQLMKTPTNDECWQAVINRDSEADGTFVYAVRTTGVYCRPGCAARLPKRANVRFYRDPKDAERAGFRACRRCRPDVPRDNLPVAAFIQACRAIEDDPGALDRAAQLAGMTPTRLRSWFRRALGITPKKFSQILRSRAVRKALDEDHPVARALFAAGYGSLSTAYEEFGTMHGMTPAVYRQGAPGHAIYFAIARSTLGWVLVATTERGICRIELDDDPGALEARLRDRFPNAAMIADDLAFAELVGRVVGAIETPAAGLDLPLDIQGTAFQRRVWDALRAIPHGSTATYAQVAERIGTPTAARAVARACATNPVAVAVPCHRVVRGDGGLGGYRWGIERKQALLERERDGGS